MTKTPDFDPDFDVVSHAISSRNTWKRAACGAFVLAVLGMASTVAISTRPVPDPGVIEVDRTTGGAKRVLRAGAYTSEATMSNKYWIGEYVASRERYVSAILQRDYNATKAFSSEEVFTEYNKQYQGSDSKDKKLLDTVTITPFIEDTTEPEKGVARVSFTLTTRDRSNHVISVARRIAMFRFTYDQRRATGELAERYNPWGFVVLSYQTDPVTLNPNAVLDTSNSSVLATPANVPLQPQGPGIQAQAAAPILQTAPSSSTGTPMAPAPAAPLTPSNLAPMPQAAARGDAQ